MIRQTAETSLEKTARDLALELARDFDIADELIIRYNGADTSSAGFTDTEKEYQDGARRIRFFNFTPMMTFGRASLVYWYNVGFSEYKSLQKMLDSRGLSDRYGELAVELLVLHEFAHVLVYQFAEEVIDTYNDKNGRFYTNIRPHGKEYQEVYAMLLDTYATQEVI